MGIPAQPLTVAAIKFFLECSCTTLRTVPIPTPTSRAILRQDTPWARSSTTFSVSTGFRGRPMRAPRARAATVISLSLIESRRIWSRGRELNSRPVDYESAAQPLSYLGCCNDDSIRGKMLSIRKKTSFAENSQFQRVNGYMAQPMATPTSKNKNSDQTMYFTRSSGRRRLRKPKATEISRANSTMACR